MTLSEYLDFLEQYWELFPTPEENYIPKDYKLVLL